MSYGNLIGSKKQVCYGSGSKKQVFYRSGTESKKYLMEVGQ